MIQEFFNKYNNESSVFTKTDKFVMISLFGLFFLPRYYDETEKTFGLESQTRDVEKSSESS